MLSERFIRYLIIPLFAPAAIIWLYFTPKYVFGCANRGLMALAVVLIALVASIATALRSIKARRHGDPKAANWWMVSTLILLSPLFLVVGPLG